MSIKRELSLKELYGNLEGYKELDEVLNDYFESQ